MDFGTSLPISYVQIWSRTDPCCLDRRNNLSIFASDDAFTSDDPYVVSRTDGVASFFALGRVARPTSIAINRSGRYVRLQAAHPGATDIAEVQVWSQGDSDTFWVMGVRFGGRPRSGARPQQP